ncbi:MAG: alkaline phosphatase family protein [Balneolia bacterium]|nr:alkaline phosphatase family protein [Balneolia bacterium]
MDNLFDSINSGLESQYAAQMEKSFFSYVIMIAVVIMLNGMVSNRAIATDQKAVAEHYVVIISIDGFSAQALWDHRVPAPVIRSLAREGAWAEGLVPSNPSLTWPNHTTLISGVGSEKHHVLFNGRVVRSNGGLPVRVQPPFDKEELTPVETLYDVAFAKGLTTGEINWPVTRNAGTLHDSFPDTPDNVGHMTEDLLWDLFEAGILEDMNTMALWRNSSAGRDDVWTRAAIHLIENRMPNLLMLHLLNVDTTLHRQGVHTETGYTAMALADYQVGDVVRALEDRGIRDRTTIFIVSDHGFSNTNKAILPNRLLINAGFLEVDENNSVKAGRAQAIVNGGFGMIYFEDPSDYEAIEQVKVLFEDHEGIYKVVRAEDFPHHGLPLPSESDQSGELAIFTKPGYGLSASLASMETLVSSRDIDYSAGHHGFHSDFPQMHSLFVASGRGIKKGTQLELIDARSVAPTAARLLGIDFSGSTGPVLYDILNLPESF